MLNSYVGCSPFLSKQWSAANGDGIDGNNGKAVTYKKCNVEDVSMSMDANDVELGQLAAEQDKVQVDNVGDDDDFDSEQVNDNLAKEI